MQTNRDRSESEGAKRNRKKIENLITWGSHNDEAYVNGSRSGQYLKHECKEEKTRMHQAFVEPIQPTCTISRLRAKWLRLDFLISTQRECKENKNIKWVLIMNSCIDNISPFCGLPCHLWLLKLLLLKALCASFFVMEDNIFVCTASSFCSTTVIVQLLTGFPHKDPTRCYVFKVLWQSSITWQRVVAFLKSLR